MSCWNRVALALPLLLGSTAWAQAQVSTNEFEGTLQVTAEEASIATGTGRILLIQVPPQTAVDTEPLLAQTAQALLDMGGKRVRVTGSLDGDILWSALVEEVEGEEAGAQVIELEEEPAPEPPAKSEKEAEPAEEPAKKRGYEQEPMR